MSLPRAAIPEAEQVLGKQQTYLKLGGNGAQGADLITTQGIRDVLYPSPWPAFPRHDSCLSREWESSETHTMENRGPEDTDSFSRFPLTRQ